jgi:hypothetical protein
MCSRDSSSNWKIPFYSINYDFVPTIPNGYKALWVVTKTPLTNDLPIGTVLRVVADNPYFRPPNDRFKVVDVIGTRVVLSPIHRHPPPRTSFTPYEPQTVGRDAYGWEPWSHGPQWGYMTRQPDTAITPPWWLQDKNWTYGVGEYAGYLEWC